MNHPSRYPLLSGPSLLLSVALCSGAGFELIDDFDGAPGPLNGQNAWRSNLGMIAADPEDPENQSAVFMPGNVNRGTYKETLLPDGNTGTLFLRLRVATDNADPATPVINWSAGMSDLAIAGEGAFGDFESQLNQNRDAGNTLFGDIRIRDAGAFDNLFTLQPGAWYKVWMVINNATDTTRVHMQGGQFPTQTLITGSVDGQTDFGFRNSAGGPVANDLIRVFIRLTTTHAGDLRLDDLWLDPAAQNLTDPTTLPVPPRLSGLTPTNGAAYYRASDGLSFTVRTADPGGIPAEQIKLTLNGTDVSSQLTLGGTANARTVSYNGLEAETAYTAQIAVSDASSRTRTVNFTFDTLQFPLLPPEYAATPGTVNTADRGFNIFVHQATFGGVTLPNSTDRAESQLRGRLINPATSQPYPNLVTGGPNFTETGTINWNVNMSPGIGSLVEIGNFRSTNSPSRPDVAVPGVPGSENETNNIAAEIIAYLDLPVGGYQFGVNSDDGFRLSSARNPKDRIGTQLGIYEGGRGSADSLFFFRVEEAGIYPVRLVWYQGNGGGNLEFFSVDMATGRRILINDPDDAAAIRAYRTYTGPALPYLDHVSPLPGATFVPTTSTLAADVMDLGGAALTLRINDAVVTPQVNTVGNRTEVRYAPPGGLTLATRYHVTLTYGAETASWEFVTPRGPKALYVLGDPNSIVAADQLLIDRLFAFGFDVLVRDDAASVTADGTDADLILISATVADGSVTSKFRDLAVPVVNWEPNIQDDLWLTYNVANTDFGTLAAQTQILITAEGAAHPMGAGLSAGVHTVTSAASTFTWGYPNFDASAPYCTVIARLNDGNQTHACIYGYDTGESLLGAGNFPPAPARRVHLFLSDTTYAALNGTGVQLVDAALSWAVDRELALPTDPPQINRPAIAGGNITVTWENGGELQSSSSIAGGWVGTGNTTGSFTESVGGGAKFYRVQRAQ